MDKNWELEGQGIPQLLLVEPAGRECQSGSKPYMKNRLMQKTMRSFLV